MAKYYIVADGGGSKLQAILYDENFKIIRTSISTGVNQLFKPVDAVLENLRQVLSDLLRDDIDEVESVDLCLVCSRSLAESVFDRDERIKRVVYHGEAELALAAAFAENGVVALSGTGSDVFMVSNGRRLGTVGGWGPLLGDEGSGYDIGLKTLKAAIYAQDGRGEETALLNMVMEKWKCNALWDIVSHLANNPDARHEVASAARLASRAANAGDPVAIGIYEYAAMEMFHQTKTIVEKFRSEWNKTVVITGGAWKGCRVMLERFREEICREYPGAIVLTPAFEPVVGCVVLRCLRDGMSMDEIRSRLTPEFSEFKTNYDI